MPTPLPLLPPLSSPENIIIAEFEEELPPLIMELLLPSVAESILVDGATVSTVQLREAGEGSLFATLSSDNTLNVWIPSFNDLEYVKGLVHVTNSDLSMLQPKWSIPTPPVSLPKNANVIEVDFVLAPLVMVLLLPSVAESILVDGATVSTVQLREAGEGSLFPTLSSDNTLKVWTPSFNDCGSLYGLVHVTNSDLSMLQPKWAIPTPQYRCQRTQM